VLWAALAAAALVVLAGGGWAVWYRSTYHVWPGEGIPPRIHWCGRDDERGPDPAMSGAAARKALGGPLQPVMRVPPIDSHELYASAHDAPSSSFVPAATPTWSTSSRAVCDPGRYAPIPRRPAAIARRASVTASSASSADGAESPATAASSST